MGDTAFADTDQAEHLADVALTAVRDLLDTCLWRLLPEQLLTLGRNLELLARTLYTAQVHLAGEIDTRAMAAARSCPSTAALLRQAYQLSHADAIGRVNTARKVLPREQLTGPDTPPVLPLLADALRHGRIGPEHTRTIIDTMNKIPTTAPTDARDTCEQALVDLAVDSDPNYLARAAQRILERVDPDGDDDTPPAAKMGLSFGGRNIRTGLTPLTGHLDDHGVEIIKKAIDALSAPHPAADGAPDPRTPSNRRAHGLIAAVRGYLDAGAGPAHGGERPHLTIILHWDAITAAITDAGYDTGGHLTAAQARRFLCDAQMIPMILGSDNEILDVGRKTRSFPASIRRAVAARDRGCAWPGCDRPPNWCDAHHIKFWGRDHGATSLDNGVLLCPYHHSEIHREEWVIQMTPNGTPTFIPPKWIDPQQKPRTNQLHHFHAGGAP